MPKSKHLDTLLELKENPSLSQRSLAHRLNISLGLTNAILQNLIHRGLVKAKKLTGRKILYLITPQGMARATNLIYQGMARATNLIYDRFRETQNYYQYTKELLTSYLTELYNQGKRKVIINGTNQLAEITYLSLLDSSLKLHSIITVDPTLPKKKFLGHKVLTLPDFIEKYSLQLSEKSQKELVIISTVNPGKLQQEIKKHQNIRGNIKIINLEDILRNLKT
jgi:DNA-binding MarR family transcriptional regulator